MFSSPSGAGPFGVGPRRKVAEPAIFTSHLSGTCTRSGWTPSGIVRQELLITSASFGRRSSGWVADASADSSAVTAGGGGGGLSHPRIPATTTAANHLTLRF